jgi:uncharacterized protein (DUF2062 family)/SAM-dependent methyltransferase
VARPARPPSLFREELKRAWYELRGANHTPGRAAAAVALGLFIGSIPIYGAHTPLVLTICLLLQLDGLLAWVASNVSNPFFSPFLLTAEVQVGAYLKDGAFLHLSLDSVREMGVLDFLIANLTYIAIGSPVVAAAITVVGATLVYVFLVIKRRFAPARKRPPYTLPDDAPPWWHATERVAQRYAPVREISTPGERTRFHYVRVKLLTDPVTKMIVDRLGERDGTLGEVLDLGTGRGQMPLIMLELGSATRARGLDWDEDKVENATRAASAAPELAASFEVADLADVDGPPFAAADTVLLIDVIHYMTLAEQDALLGRAAEAVRPGGRLIVREADTERGWRSWMTLAEELFFTTLRFNRGARVRFRPAREIAERLGEHGLECRVEPAWGKTPFSNVLIIAERPP